MSFRKRCNYQAKGKNAQGIVERFQCSKYFHHINNNKTKKHYSHFLLGWTNYKKETCLVPAPHDKDIKCTMELGHPEEFHYNCNWEIAYAGGHPRQTEEAIKSRHMRIKHMGDSAPD